MKLRTQLIVAFFLFSVVPLTGVTLYSYYSTRQAFRQSVENESGALAKDMERRMGEVTDDLQSRIDRLSVLPQWASFSGEVPPERWNEFAVQVQEDLGSAAGLLKNIEFTPVAPPAGEGSAATAPRAASPEMPLLPGNFRIDLSGFEGVAASIDEEFIAEKVGDQLVVRKRSEAGDGVTIPGVEDPAKVLSMAEEFNKGLEALTKELESRDQQRRAGIDVPVAQPEDFEFLLTHQLGSAVRAEGKELGTVRAEISTRELLRRVLSRSRQERGEIPFAIDAEGKLYTPDPAHLSDLEPLGLTQRVAGDGTAGTPDPNWVTVLQTDESSGLTFGIARPVGDSLAQIRNAAATNLAFGLALVGLALSGIIPLSRRMTRNLSNLTEGAEQLAAGNLDSRVATRSRDEFGQLAGTFNRMAHQLGENQKRLVEQERLGRELELCRQIQDELLPQGTYRSPQAHVTGVSVPAKELGGDFFNYFPLGNGELGILVGDVSGKGVGAALLMANVQATLKARLPLERDLAKLADSLDREISDNTPDEVYLTLFLGILDPERQELRYVNGGHTPPLVVREDNSIDRLIPNGRPPGLLPGGGYKEQTVSMRENDSLFLYTDGLVEAEDHDGQPFGVDRLEELLLEERDRELEELLVVVRQALEQHQGGSEADDDATLVALKIPAGAASPAAAGSVVP